MSKYDFKPGQLFEEIELEDGRAVQLRAPRWQDLESLLYFINTLSAENTFIRFSGEEISLEDEADWLAQELRKNELGAKITVFAVHDGEVIGNCAIEQDSTDKARGTHRAELGVSLAREFRGLGLGTQLIETCLERCRERLEDISLVTLSVFENNPRAQHVYEKLGFQQYGRLPDGLQYEGEFHDMIYMYKKL
jgi:RimJ/RimL family protein N-acetyltransferase